MSGNNNKKSVIQYLEQNGFKFVKHLGSGGYADVISVLTPSKEEAAVKIVEKEKIWEIEDEIWPAIKHPHLLEVIKVPSIESLNIKLYFMPIMPKVLGFTVHEKKM